MALASRLRKVSRWLAAAILLLSTHLTAAERCTSVAYKSMHPPLYPAEAVAARVEGKAFVRIAVGEDGVPSNIMLEKSSGNSALDQAALAAVRDWRFEPIRCNGKAVQSPVVVPVDFSLENDMASPLFSVTPDDQPMEFADVHHALDYLQSRQDVIEIPNLPRHRTFRDRTFERLWFIDQEPITGWLTVTRWRQSNDRGGRGGRVAFQCAGPKDYCTEMQQKEMDFFRDHPPPPPPPPPPANAPVER